MPALLPGGLVKRERHFWLIVGLITLGGAVLRVLMHDYHLPWYSYHDEAQIVRGVLGLRGLLPEEVYKEIYGYPPLTLWLHEMAQRLAEAQGRPNPTDALLDVRRLFMVFNIAGIVWSALLGRLCGGAAAGILAALLWAFAHIMLDLPVHALGESLAAPLFILSVLLATQGFKSTGNWRWALASLLVAAACFLLEYRLVIAFLPGFAALALRLRHLDRSGWRRSASWAVPGVALVVATGAAVFSYVPTQHRDIIARVLTEHLWDLTGLFEHFRQALTDAGNQILNQHLVNFTRESLPWLTPFAEQARERAALLPLFIFVLALLAWLLTRRAGKSPLWRPALLMTGAALFLTLWANSAIRPYGDDVDLKLRHVIPAVSLLFVLMAVALARTVAALPGSPVRSLATAGLVAVLTLNLVVPVADLVRERRVLPWPVIVRPWVDTNLEPGTILVYHESERWFNPLYSGIPHRQWFDWLETEDVLERPLQEWIDTHKITWLTLPVVERQRLLQESEGREFLTQLLPLREFTGPPARAGVETVFYRLWRMQHESDVRFGEHIRLVGYDLHPPDARPGEELVFTLYWNASAPPPENYSFFLHLVSASDARPLAQLDGNPAVPERLTQTWDRPEETLISPRLNLPLPPDLAPGDYRVLLGLYNFETGARLPVRDASGAAMDDAWELMSLHIESASNDATAAD